MSSIEIKLPDHSSVLILQSICRKTNTSNLTSDQLPFAIISSMAYTSLTSNYQNKANIGLLGLLVLTLSMIQTSDATTFPVGGTGIWSPKSTNYAQWAEENRFTIGDSIAFNYTVGQDSVLVVNKHDYTNCNTDSPFQNLTTGNTLIKFPHAGNFFFISGKKDNCLQNQKLEVTVMPNTSETPPPLPPNGASASFLSFIGYMGAFAASSFVLVF